MDWGMIYGVGCLVAYAVLALMCFFGIWGFASARYGLPGLVLGWVPGLVAAATLAVIGAFLWPLIVIGGLWFWWFWFH